MRVGDVTPVDLEARVWLPVILVVLSPYCEVAVLYDMFAPMLRSYWIP